MKRRLPAILLACVFFAIAVWMNLTSIPAVGTGSTGVTAPDPPLFIVHIDPTTRQFLDNPTPVLLRDDTDSEKLNRSSSGLRIEPSPVGGGLMVNLQGRFQTTYAATVDDGYLSAKCERTEE